MYGEGVFDQDLLESLNEDKFPRLIDSKAVEFRFCRLVGEICDGVELDRFTHNRFTLFLNSSKSNHHIQTHPHQLLGCTTSNRHNAIDQAYTFPSLGRVDYGIAGVRPHACHAMETFSLFFFQLQLDIGWTNENPMIKQRAIGLSRGSHGML